jgi:hypothetical protein
MTGSRQPQHWIYPIADGSGRQFSGPGDARCRARYPDYRRAVLSGRITRGEGPLESGFRSIQAGDVLWLYAGIEVGVVGRAHVTKLAGRPAPWVTFSVDRPISRVLAQDPVPGNLIRRGFAGVFDGPVPLADHPEAYEGLQWWVDQLDERDRRRLEPIGVSTLRHTLARQPSLLDPPALGALVRTLRSQDLAVGVDAEPDGVARIVGLNGTSLVIGQAVPGSQAAVPADVVRSLGMLVWSGWSLAQRAPKLGLEPHVFLACKKPPSVELVRFLEDQHHLVLWVHGTQVDFGPRTRLRWQSGLQEPRPLFARHA